MSHSDFKTEALPGLPEELPEGEDILWQGRPNAWRLAWDAMWLKWIAIYFAALIIWRVVASWGAMSPVNALGTALPLVILALVITVLIYGLAVAQSRATLYTITSARVVMRIGLAFTMTINLPFSRISSADLAVNKDGTGTIAFTPKDGTRMAITMLWPHYRSWHSRHPQPALRCISDAAAVAKFVGEAAKTTQAQPQVSTFAEAMA